MPEPASSPGAETVHIQIVPAVIWARVSDKVPFSVRGFDEAGRKTTAPKAEFSLSGLQGEIAKNGTFTPDKNAGMQAGYVIAKVGELESRARVQVSPGLPMELTFEDFEVNKNPPFWPCASKFIVKSVDDNKVLMKPPSRVGLNRHNLFIGTSDMSGYTIQADLKGVKVKRRSPDMGLIANRYYFDFMTKKKRLQLRTWPAELERFSKEVDFTWTPDIWYTMKMRVDIENGKAIVQGKVWPRDQKEPEAWTITAEDPHPNTHGSPGLYGDAPTPIYYDNVKITRSK
ncbi:MAG: hypothetical protein ACE5G1_08170 [bacterium]